MIDDQVTCRISDKRPASSSVKGETPAGSRKAAAGDPESGKDLEGESSHQ